MRLTKGQLKRIIREEYTRLKRSGLLREFGPVPGDEMDDFEDEKGAAPYSPKKGRRTTGGDRFGQALAALKEDILACANGGYHDKFDGHGNYYSCMEAWQDKLIIALWSWLKENGFKDVADNSKMYNKLFREAERFIEQNTDFDPWVKDYNWD